MRKWLLIIVTLVALGCQLLAPRPAVDRPTRERESRTTASGLTLRQAWTKAHPELAAWAGDARPAERWQCRGLQPDGACRQWSGMMASPARKEAAQVTVGPDQVEVRVNNAGLIGEATAAASFPAEGIMDSPDIVAAARTWLAAAGFAAGESRLRSVSLLAGPAQALNCGETVHYRLIFDSPSGWLCLDPHSGRITGHSFER